jgi:hypothetical protein
MNHLQRRNSMTPKAAIAAISRATGLTDAKQLGAIAYGMQGRRYSTGAQFASLARTVAREQGLVVPQYRAPFTKRRP